MAKPTKKQVIQYIKKAEKMAKTKSMDQLLFALGKAMAKHIKKKNKVKKNVK